MNSLAASETPTSGHSAVTELIVKIQFNFNSIYSIKFDSTLPIPRVASRDLRDESNARGVVVSGVGLKPFRARLVGPSRVPLKRRRLCLVEKLENRRETDRRCDVSAYLTACTASF